MISNVTFYSQDSCTTTLSRHLARCHPDVIETRDSVRAEESVIRGESIESFVVYGGAYFQQYLKWVVFTFQPISTCENVHFRRMCSELSPKVQHFDRHKVTRVIGEQACRVRATLKVEMIDKHFTITCGHWTSIAGTNYLGVTVHYVNEKWKMKSFTLSCVEHVGKAKADDILLELSNAWKSYNLDPKNMVGVVTDTAPVMGVFGRQLPGVVPHFYCVDHVIELTTVNNMIYDLLGVFST